MTQPTTAAQPARNGPPILPGAFSRLDHRVISRELPRDVRGVPVVLGRSGVHEGRVIRVLPVRNRYDSPTGHRAVLYSVDGLRVIAETHVPLCGEYLAWRLNRMGAPGAYVEWPDALGIRRAVLGLAAHL